ncbi:hypothetical protein A5906_25810 [Bradyrhizobium sacchari]|uniref:Uncharacterized protein n=1 Tax=Bradyrhizobium sacchari TaxID=1399419 RepID=A0A560JY56_9BRAD|nr:hypothetical protein [Bradyrhizobium sacchari]OPY99158.1 hypothetical protein A5906_25810 [Bradyrhizobium sacchari]TWB63045.1 hypothetical protein FBZ94_103745 [Bradyrhizobium sacchari]TWB76025.1 hypothetical protein FBZ95_104205 [Bradyrhizobium sacchari]
MDKKLKLQTAFIFDLIVRVAAGLRCPHCASELRACDMTLDRAGNRAGLICSRCHSDILKIEPNI